MQIQIRVDTVFLERGDQIIEAVERFGVERVESFVAAFENAVGEGLVVHVVEAHGVDAEACEARGELVGLLVRGEGRAEAEIYAEEADALAVWPTRVEMAILDDDGTVFAGGFVEEGIGGENAGEIGNAGDGEIGPVGGGRGERGGRDGREEGDEQGEEEFHGASPDRMRGHRADYLRVRAVQTSRGECSGTVRPVSGVGLPRAGTARTRRNGESAMQASQLTAAARSAKIRYNADLLRRRRML